MSQLPTNYLLSPITTSLLIVPAGSAAAPALAFGNGSQGFFRIDSSTLSVAADGQQVAKFYKNGTGSPVRICNGLIRVDAADDVEKLEVQATKISIAQLNSLTRDVNNTALFNIRGFSDNTDLLSVYSRVSPTTLDDFTVRQSASSSKLTLNLNQSGNSVFKVDTSGTTNSKALTVFDGTNTHLKVNSSIITSLDGLNITSDGTTTTIRNNSISDTYKTAYQGTKLNIGALNSRAYDPTYNSALVNINMYGAGTEGLKIYGYDRANDYLLTDNDSSGRPRTRLYKGGSIAWERLADGTTTMGLPGGTTTQTVNGNLKVTAPSGTSYNMPGTSGGVPEFAVHNIISVSSNTTAVDGGTYLVNTSGGVVTITLPAPVKNACIVIKDGGNAFATNNCTIARAGSEKIEFVAASYVLNTNKQSVRLISNGTDWFII